MNTQNISILLSSVGALVIANIFCNIFGKKQISNNADIIGFNLVGAGASVITFFAMSGGIQIPTLYTIGMGFLFGTLLTAYQTTYYRALAIGSFAYTTLIASCGMIIPTIVGSILWKEPVNIYQIIGIVLILVMFYLTTNPSKGDKVNLKWVMLVMLLFIGCGCVGLMQKFLQLFDKTPQMTEFLIIAFITIMLYSSIFLFVEKKKNGNTFPFKSKAAISAVIVGIGSAINHRLNLYLACVMPSAIFFPLVNGLYVVLCAVVSYILFKEKYTAKQFIGIGIGVIAILLVSNIMSNFYI